MDIGLLVLIIVGLGFSLYAMIEVVDPVLQSGCSASPYFSCGTVTQSGKTSVLGVPDWAIGVGGFTAMLALEIPSLWSRDGRLTGAILGLSVVGLAFSAYFAYIELGSIHAVCPVCLGAYAADFGVLLYSWKLTSIRKLGPKS